MKKIFLSYPVLSRFILALVLGVLSLILSGLLPVKGFPYIGVVFLTISTWILYKTDNKSLKAIGLDITVRHILFLLLGLAIGIIALGIYTYLRTFYTGERLHVSTTIDQTILWKDLYIILPTVAVQELMFRGYLFTKTIEISNVVKANIIFSILFMLVHVIDRDVLQRPPQIISLVISIPVGHLFFATGLLRSKTLFFPIGLHWGNNWAVNHLIGYADNNHAIFYTSNQKIINSWPSFIILLLIFNGFFLLVTLLIWKWKKKKVLQINPDHSLPPL